MLGLVVVVGLVFTAVSMIVWSVLSLLFGDERAVAGRLSSLTAYETGQAVDANPTLRPFSERVVQPIGDSVNSAVSSLAPEGYRQAVQQRLVRAGSPRNMSVGRFVTSKFLSAFGVLFSFLAVAVFSNLSTFAWVVGLALAVLAFFSPDMWLSGKISERQTKIRRELPDFLDMLTISVEAGLGFDAAIAKLVRTTQGPLTEEFALMLKQVQAGADRTEAMRAMGERTDVADLNSFIAAIVQADQFGISIAGVLRAQAKEMRLKRRQFAEEQAQKAPVKIIFPLVLCVLPATMIVVLGPAIVSIGRAFNLL